MPEEEAWFQDVALLWKVAKEQALPRWLALAALVVTVSVLALGVLGPVSATGAIGQAAWLGFCLLLLRALGRVPDRVVRRTDDPVVWRDLTFSIIFWMTAEILVWLTEPLDSKYGFSAPVLLLTAQVLRTLSYVGLYLAVERQPHRRHRWRPIELERQLLLPTVWLVAFGLILYFWGIPFFFGPENKGESLSSSAPCGILGGYLLIRLVYLIRVTESPRWRPIYWGLALSLVSRVASDLLSPAARAEGPWLGCAMLSVWSLMLVADARQRAFKLDPVVPHGRFRVEENLPGPLGQTMIFLLLFPLAHYMTRILGWLDPALGAQREELICLLLVALGAGAFYQHHVFFGAMVKLRDEYALTERRLRRVELDIRAQSRSKKERSLANVSSMSLARAFDACTDAIAVASTGEARLLDVNDAFLTLFGFFRHEVLGHTLPELGVWSDPKSFQELASLARDGEPRDSEPRDGKQHCFEAGIRRKSGRPGQGLFFIDSIEIDEQPYLLVVIRDITRHQLSRQELTLGIALLDGLNITLAGLSDSAGLGDSQVKADALAFLKDLTLPEHEASDG